MRRASIVVALAGAVACTTNDGSLQIYQALVPDGSCVFSPSGTFITGGTYDPRGFGGARPREFVLGLAVRNTLSTPTTDSPAGSENANDAQIISVDACWFPAHPGSEGEPVFESYVNGVPDDLTCNKLPDDQKKTITTASPVPANGEASVVIQLFDEAALKNLYDAEFEPWKIPDAGPIPVVQGSVVNWKYSFAAADPSNAAGRDPAWGKAFPTQESARVIVQVRANAQLLSGTNIQSNWFVYPVDICPGCLGVACGLQDMIECTPGSTACGDGNPCPPGGACPGGSYCAPGTMCPDGITSCPTPQCMSGGACDSGTWALEGTVPDPLADSACYPFQDLGPPCIAASGC